ncbi:MAG: HAD family hydrolase [Bacteroidota bacterium]
MKIEGIIFDLDGTLVHTIEDLGDAANAVLKRNGFSEHTTSEYLQWIGNGAVKFIENALGPDIPVDQLQGYVTEFKEFYSRNLNNKSRLYDRIPQVLDQLTERGVKLAILSNKPHYLTEKVTSYYLSDWKFDPVFGQRDHVPRKPDPAAALEIAEILGIAEKRILFVGDSLGDLNTAIAAGMVPVGVTWGYGRLDTGAKNGHSFITNPQELLTLLD